MVNPVSRITGILGLLMMGAIAYQVVAGQITLTEAGSRAGITLLAVIVVRKIGRLGMNALAGSMERQAAVPRRRATDEPENRAV
jgi:hypothetical protein